MSDIIDSIKKTYEILSSQERKGAAYLLVVILITALFDVLGIASILPFIAVLSNPNLISSNEFLINTYQIFSLIGVKNEKQFLFVLGIMVLILLMISLTFRALTQYLLFRFSLRREFTIGKKIIKCYLHQPYSWFLQKNSANLGKNILSEVNTVIQQTIIPILNFFAQSAIVVTIIILLIIIDPVLALSVGFVLSISYFGIFYYSRKTLSQLGKERFQANLDRFSIVAESFGGVKELKIRGMENFFIQKFSKPSEIYANKNALAAIIGNLPRFFLEGIAFGGILIIILVLMSTGKGFTNILPIISLYAFAGYRLLPALQQIYNSLTQMRFSKLALHALHKDLISLNSDTERLDNNYSEKDFFLQKSIDLKNIYFKYPNSKDYTIKNLTCTIPALSKTAIIGTTGSGKTTIVDIILGLIEPNKGFLTCDGKNIDKQNKRFWQKNIGYVPQQIYLSDDSVAANIAFGVEKKNINQKSLEKAAKLANIHEFIIKELENQYDTNLGERGIRLSGGQRQRIGIARALYNNPKIIIFDEATSALDNITEKVVMESIYNLESDVTVILITHRISIAKEFDKILLLDEGSLKVQGTFEELSKENIIFKKMIGETR